MTFVIFEFLQPSPFVTNIVLSALTLDSFFFFLLVILLRHLYEHKKTKTPNMRKLIVKKKKVLITIYCMSPYLVQISAITRKAKGSLVQSPVSSISSNLKYLLIKKEFICHVILRVA